MKAGTWPHTLCLSARAATALAVLGICGLIVGCGGDDEDEPAQTAAAPTQTTREPVTTPPPETTPRVEKPKRDPEAEEITVPEEEQQGDEEPIRSEAVFTGTGGKLTPRVVRVPPFIAIRVILRGTDTSREQGYTLTIGGQRLAIGHERAVDEADLAGLLPNKSYAGRGPQGNVRIAATAEPGP